MLHHLLDGEARLLLGEISLNLLPIEGLVCVVLEHFFLKLSRGEITKDVSLCVAHLNPLFEAG